MVSDVCCDTHQCSRVSVCLCARVATHSCGNEAKGPIIPSGRGDGGPALPTPPAQEAWAQEHCNHSASLTRHARGHCHWRCWQAYTKTNAANNTTKRAIWYACGGTFHCRHVMSLLRRLRLRYTEMMLASICGVWLPPTGQRGQLPWTCPGLSRTWQEGPCIMHQPCHGPAVGVIDLHTLHAL